jgi:hypothetical protein
MVYVSAVGADRIRIVSRVDRAMFGYFGYKLAAERVFRQPGKAAQAIRAGANLAPDQAVGRDLGRLPDRASRLIVQDAAYGCMRRTE